jgi:hypothetical protein
MEDHVVDFIVAMDECTPVLWLCLRVSEKLHHIVEVRDLSYWFPCLLRYSLRLRSLYGVESPQLAIVEARWLAELLHVHAGWDDTVEFGECFYCIFPPSLCQSSGLDPKYIKHT